MLIFITKAIIPTVEFVEENFIKPNKIKNVWLSYGATYKPYILVMLVSPSNFNFLALFQPMDKYCWFCLLVSYVFGTALIYFLTKCKSTDTLPNKNATMAGFWTFSLILEQSFSTYLNR